MLKKILPLIVLVALLGGAGVAAASTTFVKKAVKGTGTACVQTAVENRETALIAAYEKKAEAIKAALQTRKTALIAAWGKSTVAERKQARNAAWKAFREAVVAARQTYQKEVKNAWATFNTDFKKCKVENPEENGGTDLGM